MRFSSVMFLAGLMIASGPAQTQETLTGLEVSLGDVSLNKVPFLVAADEGIYAKHGLAVHQYITPYAADKAYHQGLDVPPEYVKDDSVDDAHIAVGGGTPMIVRMTRDVRATDRVIIATFENRVRNHIVSSWEIDSPEDLKGKRLGYSNDGAVTHLAAISFARLMGWDPHRDISLFGHGNTPSAITGGKIDAFVGSVLVRSLAAQANLKDLVDLSQYEIAVAGSGLNAERGWLLALVADQAQRTGDTESAGTLSTAALELLDRAVELDPALADPYAYRAVVYAELVGDADRAEEDVEAYKATGQTRDDLDAILAQSGL
ncbi:MAG: ABC transporter substrate-binding protein [Acidobacteria bacterium]|nr:ABC transporter substrate-binding protein [Acidobacteriota bacterium]